jgi:hypothetical protein
MEGGRERSCKQATGVSVINTLAGRNARRTGRTIKTRTRCLDHDSLWATDHAIRLLCQINADKDPSGASQVEPAAHCQRENWPLKGRSRMGHGSWTRAQQRLEENERWKWDGSLAGRASSFLGPLCITHRYPSTHYTHPTIFTVPFSMARRVIQVYSIRTTRIHLSLLSNTNVSYDHVCARKYRVY